MSLHAICAHASCTLQTSDHDLLVQPLVQPLTTRDGQIIGIDGEVIDLKGIAWFGFDDGNSMLDGLWEARPTLSAPSHTCWAMITHSHAPVPLLVSISKPGRSCP